MTTAPWSDARRHVTPEAVHATAGGVLDEGGAELGEQGFDRVSAAANRAGITITGLA